MNSPAGLGRSSRARYRVEGGKYCIEISIKSSRQLFDARDPAPFRERDLDDNAAKYIVSAAEEFSLKTPVKLLIHIHEGKEERLESDAIREAIHGFFAYESELQRKKLRRTLATGRGFLGIGLAALVTCLGLAELVQNLDIGVAPVQSVLREGLVISGWVAMWRPIELFLYDWWPLTGQIKHLDKLAGIEVEIRYGIPAVGA